MEPLFSKETLKSVIENKIETLKTRISGTYFSKDTIRPLKQQFLDNFSIKELSVNKDKITNKPVKGVRTTNRGSMSYEAMQFKIPYSGSANLFSYSPTPTKENFLPGNISGDSIEIDILYSGDLQSQNVQENISSEAIKAVEFIEWHIDALNKEVKSFNDSLSDLIDSEIQNNLDKVANDNDVIKKTNPFKKD